MKGQCLLVSNSVFMTTSQVLSLNDYLSLSSKGFSPSSIKFSTTSLDTPNFLTVREEIEGVKTVSIVNLQNINADVERHKMGAEQVRMHPTENIIALKADSTVQVYNLEKGQRLASHKLSTPISFIKWVSDDILVVVTTSTVFHLALSSPTDLPRVFDLSEPMKNVTLLNYSVSVDHQWCCLTGMDQDPSTRKMIGRLQLYSIQKGATQNIEGNACGFTSFNGVNVFCFLVNGEGSFKFQSIPLGSAEGLAKISREVSLESASDFPLSVHLCPSMLALVVTKTSVFLIDVTTGNTIDSISTGCTIFSSVWSEDLILTGVSSVGSVVKLNTDTLSIISSCLSRGLITSALGLIRRSCRTSEALELLKQAPSSPGKPPLLLLHFHQLMEQKMVLNEVESLELVRILLNKNQTQLLEKYLREDKFTPTSDIGDLVSGHDRKLGLAVYLKGQVHEKVVSAFISMELYDKVLQYSARTGYLPNYSSIIENLVDSDADRALKFAKTCSSSEPKPSYEDLLSISNIFFSRSLCRHATDFVLDILTNVPEEHDIQTRLLEANFDGQNLTVVDKLLAQGILSHYDRVKVAKLSETHGLYHRALQHLDDVDAQKECWTGLF
ncbi:hypothetical protein GEMRC1_007562 [Eukaryota sp. GEM-RC1]